MPASHAALSCVSNHPHLFATVCADLFFNNFIEQLKKYFTFEVQVLDDKNVRRRFRASNYQSTTRVKPFICTMPMRLDEGWNQIQFNLSDFTRRAYGTNYIETLRVQIHANCRIRRCYTYSHTSCLPIPNTGLRIGTEHTGCESAKMPHTHLTSTHRLHTGTTSSFCSNILTVFLALRIYFSDRLYSEDELPPEFKLFLPVQTK